MSDKPFYINSLDGIRAIAVMLVFVGHAGFSHIVPGGFGVTIFFFLSGFLITTLLRIEYEKNSDVSFANFYLRRIYRIFPPLYILLFVVIILSFSGVFTHNMKFEAVAAQFLHLTNYYTVLIGDAHFVPGTGVLWSLAVEEHFYMFFPLIFLVLIKKLCYRNIAITLAAFCFFVLLWRCYLVYEVNILQPYTYMATDTRIDSIMYGCIMGVFLNPALDKDVIKTELSGVILLVTSLIVLLFCLLYRDAEFRETFRYTLQGLALFPIFYLAVTRANWPIFRWLNWRPISFLGKISYTFYLIHITGIVLATYIIPDSIAARIVGGFLISFLYATFMYYFVERRFSMLRKRLHAER